MRCERLRTAQFAGAIALAASTAFAAACGGSSNSSTVTAPTGTVTTDTFNGTVQQAGSSSNNFTVTVAGSVSVTLVSAGPPATISMGLGIGNPSSTGTCSFLSGGTTVTTAMNTAQLSGTLNAGTYCVAVVDVGNAAGPITYTVTVAHT
jgi:hypothetical protein